MSARTGCGRAVRFMGRCSCSVVKAVAVLIVGITATRALTSFAVTKYCDGVTVDSLLAIEISYISTELKIEELLHSPVSEGDRAIEDLLAQKNALATRYAREYDRAKPECRSYAIPRLK
jgi:hypothetical protein